MTLFIAHLDKYLRARFNATVLLVHHTGHGSSERGRGSSALKAAVDTEYSMIKNDAGVINLSCTKMKDAPHPSPKSFQIKAVDLRIADEKGNPANGPVLIETTYEPEAAKTKVLGKWEQLGISSLEILQAEARESFIEEGENPNDAKVSALAWRDRLGIPKQRFYDVRKSLQDKGLVIIENGYVSLVEDTQD